MNGFLSAEAIIDRPKKWVKYPSNIYTCEEGEANTYEKDSFDPLPGEKFPHHMRMTLPIEHGWRILQYEDCHMPIDSFSYLKMDQVCL